MHPAYSVIVFTTTSGAGYGLLVWLALASLLGLVPVNRWTGSITFGLALALITTGLLASTAHLGRPERAWRAFSQWRTSWLSREGVMAVSTYVPAGLLALSWIIFEDASGIAVLLAVLTILCALLTIFTTGMIYASLRTIRQWHQPLTAPIYVVLGLASGAVLLNLLLRVFGVERPSIPCIAICMVFVGGILKWLYWRAIDGELRTHTIEAATGLGHLGKVRQLDPPHTQPNYVMREMGYRVARKHARKLRTIASIFAFGIPVAAILLSIVPSMGIAASALAVLSMAAGLTVERWLFFAEAEHVSMLYYGADAA